MKKPEPASDDAATLAAMSPVERAHFQLAQRQLAATEEANRIARASFRMQENHDAVAAEKNRQAEEERARRCATLTPVQVRLAVPHTLDRCVGKPRVDVAVTGVGVTDENGTVTLNALRDWSAEEAEAIIHDECISLIQGMLAEAERAADEADAASLRKAILGKARPDGFKHRRWVEVHQPLIAAIIGAKKLTGRTLPGDVKETRPATLQELVTDGVVRIVGDIQPTGGPVDPTRMPEMGAR